MAKYLDPKSDLTFKKVFGENKDLMISFLNALLPLQPGREVVEIEYLSSELVPDHPEKKDSIVDVRCKDTLGRQFLVEMQMYWTDAFKQRALFNTCKAYVEPVEKGEKFEDIKPIYTISLVNDIAFPELPEEFYHVYVPMNKAHEDHVIDDMKMVFIELPKFKPSSVEDKKMMVLWLRFLTEINEKTRQAPEELINDELVTKALSLLEDSAYTPEQKRAIDRYWDMVSRERTIVFSSRQEGIAEGRAEGLAEGLAEGRAEGLAEGEKKKQLEIAVTMKADGIPVDRIQKYTGLTDEEIENL